MSSSNPITIVEIVTQGPQGPQGADGAQGPQGEGSATVAIGTVTTGNAGSSATVTNVGTTTAATLDFTIPRGDTGATGSQGIQGVAGNDGSDGAAATISVGSTTTGNAGTNASVTNTGTSNAAILNFTIPKGDTGATGAAGSDGSDGSDGAAATIAIGTVTTGNAGSSAVVTNSGSSNAATFNFTIPKGDTGAQGPAGQDGQDGADGAISDGDKGDIVVSNSGATFTIDNDVVTAAKLADTGVTAGSYTNADITVDEQGRITSASSGSAGGVTSVTGTTPIVSSGGATPAISISAATTSAAGSMSASDKSKLDGIEASATADQTDAEIKTAYENNSDTNAFTDAEKTKLAGVEASATADQTASEIRTLVESATDSNVFTDADHTKLNAIEDNATADQTGSEIKSLYEGESDTNAFTDSEKTKLSGIESNATADQTDAEIKTAYEANSDTNAFTDAEKTKLSGIAASANNYSISSDLLDEDNMASNSATKVPSQQSVKAYVDANSSDTTYTAGTGLSLSGTTFNVDQIALTTVQTAANESAQLALTTQEGDIVVRSDQNKSYVRNSGTAGTMADFTELLTPTDQVLSVNGNTGAITAAQIAAAVEAASDSNTFTDDDHSKLDGIDVGAKDDQTSTEIKTLLQSDKLTVNEIADDAITADKLANSINTEIAANTAKVTNATHTGDVTGATALTIANQAVTYAKIQNVSATDRILGRDSAGAGVIEEITPANLRTMINVEDGATADQTKSDIDALGIAATTATTLATARNIGGVSFNGSANIDLPGVNTIGNQNTTGSAATLTTARTIAGASFDGSANIDISYTDLTNKLTVGDGGLTQNNFTDALKTKLDGANDASNLDTGTISASLVPTLNQNTTGSAATLTTARNIAGVAFDGSANIDISYSNLTNQLTASDIKTLFNSSGLVNAQIDANAAIAGTKISPDFGSQNITTTGKVLFANVYSAESDLPSASTYHGMFAHVHATGAAYFAHAGNWIKLGNASDVATNTAKVTNATHTGEVTGSTALTIADDVVDEANLKVSNTPTDGYVLTAQSGNTGGLTWAEASSGLSSDSRFNVLGGTDAGGNLNLSHSTSFYAGYNVFIGHEVAKNAVTTYSNTVIGYQAFYTEQSNGNSNTAVGRKTLYTNNGGSFSAAFGSQALENSTGNKNCAFGYLAGNNITSGINNICIGASVNASSATVSNEVTIGDSNITKFRIPGLDGFEIDDNGTIDLGGAINENVFAITDASSVALDPDNGMVQTWTLGANRTATDSLTSGQSMLLIVTATTNNYTLTWPSMKWNGGSAPTLGGTDPVAIELFKVNGQLYGANIGELS